jgi:hypothetical protein
MDWREAVKQSKLALQTIGKGKIYIDDPSSRIPNIYTPRELINRAEAERMIAEVMKLHGFDSIRCKWMRPKLLIIPV